MNNPGIITLESVDSTNDYIKGHPDIRGDFTAVRALSQPRGRGRYSRSWHMAPGLDLAFSFIFTPAAPAGNIGIYSLVCGMALRRVMLPVIGADLDIKWPNDLYCRGRKMAGILCEAVFGKNRG
jgi:BirA family transcriptional regulator, biotin operon repressor / biotin---[acetyl-CoA-carboxylase] ligase